MLCPEGKQEVLAYIRAVDSDTNCVGRIYVQTSEYGELSMELGSSEYTIKFKYPGVGAFQHGTDSLYYYRIPQRQYQRGISTGNSALITVIPHAPGNQQLSLATVRSAFERKTYTLKEGLAMLALKKARSVALSNNYSVALNSTMSDGVLVLHHRGIVAAIDSKTGKMLDCIEGSYAKSIPKTLENL